jgi:hypothetical protein
MHDRLGSVACRRRGRHHGPRGRIGLHRGEHRHGGQAHGRFGSESGNLDRRIYCWRHPRRGGVIWLDHRRSRCIRHRGSEYGGLLSVRRDHGIGRHNDIWGHFGNRRYGIRLHPRRPDLRRLDRETLQLLRHLGRPGLLHGVHRGRLHRMRSRIDGLPGERPALLRWDGSLDLWNGVLRPDPDLPLRLVRVMCSRSDAMLGVGRPGLQFERLLADIADVPLRLQRRGLHWQLLPDIHEVLGAQCSKLRLLGNLDHDVHVSHGVQLRVLWLVFVGGHPVQWSHRRVLQWLGPVAHDGHLSVRL